MHRLIHTLLRVLLVGVGVVIAGILLAAGLVFTVILLVWSLLRGRRPRMVKFRVDPRSPFSGRPQAQGDVVDIEAREVPDAPTRLTRDKR